MSSVVVLFIALVTLSLFGCTKENRYELHPVVKGFLSNISIEKSSIIEIGDYSNISYDLKTPNVSNDEIADYIESLKEDYENEMTDDALIKELGLKNIDDLNDYARNNLIEEKKISDILATRDNIIGKLLAICKFDMDVDEVANYSLAVVESYETQAYLYNLSLEEYSEQILNVPYDEFFDTCYEEGERKIKEHLVIGAIAQIEFPNMGETDLASPDEDDNEALYISYQALENEVYGLFIKTEKGY